MKFSKKAVCDELTYYRKLCTDKRVPWYSRALIWSALAYLVSPVDLIPDVIPILGQLDDLLIVPGLATAGLLLIPKDVRQAIRADVEANSKAE